MVKIKQADLLASAYKKEDFLSWEFPEIAFLGRSNVGKSSLINAMLARKNLARTSSTPGKTRGIYFYLVNRALCFVDLPGYGYARVSREERKRWAPVIEEYLRERANLYGCVHLIDCRHEPTNDDRLMSDWLRMNSVPRVSVATKADKLSRGALQQNLKVARKELGLFEDEPLIAFSIKNGTGRDQLWKTIGSMLPAR